MAANGGRGFGIVGLGTIAEFHAAAIRAMSGGHLACAYTRSGKPHKDLGVKIYRGGEFDAFLRHPGLEVVTVATPSGAHLEPALAAAKAGKHVVCEKPLEITLERCDALIAACRRHKVKLAGIYPQRFNEVNGLLKKAVGEKRLGRLSVCNALVPWHRTQQYYDSGGWRGTWNLDGGGALINQSIHTIDLLQWIAGPVAEVSAFAACRGHKRIEVEDAAVAAVRFRSGALGMILGSTSMYPGLPAEVQFSGEHGSAWSRGGRLVAWQFQDERPGDAVIRRKLGPQPGDRGGGAANPRDISFTGHQRQFENFVRHLDGAEDLAVDGHESRKAVELILAIYQSALSGKTVKLPLKKTPLRKRFS